MKSESPNASVRLAHLNFDRRIVIYAHCVLGLVSGFVYLGTQDLRHFAYWGRGGATVAMFRTLPAFLPYLVSLLFSYRLVGYVRLRTWLFIGVLVSGTAVGVALRLHPTPDTPFNVVVVMQAFAYCFAAGALA